MLINLIIIHIVHKTYNDYEQLLVIHLSQIVFFSVTQTIHFFFLERVSPNKIIPFIVHINTIY